MKRVLCDSLPLPGRSRQLSVDEGTHLIRVLRMRDGDRVEALDGKGGARLCRLRVRGKTILIEADDSDAEPEKIKRTSANGEVLPIELEMAILKGDAMEWVIEKAVELGIRSLTPLTTAHTVVQIDKKGPEAFRERWQKIADQALKQCGRLERMEIPSPLSLEEHLASALPSEAHPRFWADEAQCQEAPPLMDALTAALPPSLRILIGPEGGWSLRERDLISISAIPVSLGPLILRAETAALFSAAIASSFLRGLSRKLPA